MAKTTRATINRSKFFEAVRASIFGGSLSQQQVEGMEAILAAIERHGVLDYPPIFAGYILATARGEVGANMQPVREGFKHSDLAAREHVALLHRRGRISSDYARREPNGNSYYGRGFVQLTWPHNYRRIGERLSLPLYDEPDLALDPRIAADILVVGTMEGLFTDDRLDDYLPDSPMLARKVVNGLDRAEEFADLANKFARAIEASLEKTYVSVWETTKEAPMFAKIRKLVVAAVGVGVMWVQSQFGFDIGPFSDGIVQAILAALTAFGVYQVPNDPEPAQPE